MQLGIYIGGKQSCLLYIGFPVIAADNPAVAYVPAGFQQFIGSVRIDLREKPRTLPAAFYD